MHKLGKGGALPCLGMIIMIFPTKYHYAKKFSNSN